MSAPKQQVRARIRARRRARGWRPEDAQGLLDSWFSVLDALGLEAVAEDARATRGRGHAGSPDTLASPPALFWPMPDEPDVRRIVVAHSASLLPVLASAAGQPLPAPAWAAHSWASSAVPVVGRPLDEGGAAPGLARPHPRLPAQPSGPLLGADAVWRAPVVLAAALAVDAAGTRVGQGSGWYDRALADLPPGVPVVVAVFDEEVLEAAELPREAHDRPVDAVITPTRALVLGEAGTLPTRRD